MYLGDNILKGGSAGFIRDFDESDVDASLLLTEVEDPTQYGVALVDEQKKVIIKLVEKPKIPPSNLSIVGIYGLTPVIFKAIEKIRPSWRNELEITDALHWLIGHGYHVRYSLVDGWWKDTGRTEDILEANRLVLDMIDDENCGSVESGSVTGKVKIGKDTKITGSSVIKGPVIMGKGCTIIQSVIGPYTSIGDGCTISHATIVDSIIMEGTTIDHIDRISESLVGKNVTIRKNDNLPNYKKLVLGDCSQVML
jgi:glucose-1-phosphate thymidylyltransferase